MTGVRAGLLSAACLALTGCGGSSNSSSMSRTTSVTNVPVARCATAPGLAAGEAFVGAFSAAKYWVAGTLPDEFHDWVSGKATGEAPGAPSKPLCLQASQAAAAVVLSWAGQHQARFAASSKAQDGGKDVVGYLKVQGVICGSQCGVKVDAQGVEVERSTGLAVQKSNGAARANNTICSTADNAVTKFITAVQQGLKHPTASTASALDVSVGAVTSSLTALRPQAHGSQLADLNSDIKAFGTLQSSGTSGEIDAQAIGVALGVAPIKNLPALLGQVC